MAGKSFKTLGNKPATVSVAASKATEKEAAIFMKDYAGEGTPAANLPPKTERTHVVQTARHGRTAAERAAGVEARSKRLTFVIQGTLLEKLKDVAARHGVSINSYVHDTVEDKLNADAVARTVKQLQDDLPGIEGRSMEARKKTVGIMLTPSAFGLLKAAADDTGNSVNNFLHNLVEYIVLTDK